MDWGALKFLLFRPLNAKLGLGTAMPASAWLSVIWKKRRAGGMTFGGIGVVEVPLF